MAAPGPYVAYPMDATVDIVYGTSLWIFADTYFPALTSEQGLSRPYFEFKPYSVTLRVPDHLDTALV
jgi:hypothetical protein